MDIDKQLAEVLRAARDLESVTSDFINRLDSLTEALVRYDDAWSLTRRYMNADTRNEALANIGQMLADHDPESVAQ